MIWFWKSIPVSAGVRSFKSGLEAVRVSSLTCSPAGMEEPFFLQPAAARQKNENRIQNLRIIEFESVFFMPGMSIDRYFKKISDHRQPFKNKGTTLIDEKKRSSAGIREDITFAMPRSNICRNALPADCN